MTTKNFNAKKMLMSTLAAVVFSFVFTTSANARCNDFIEADDTEVSQDAEDEDMPEINFNDDDSIFDLNPILGIRV